jgi:phosphocarrier protein
MGLMMLAASKGTKIDIRAKGEDSKAAIDAICKLVKEKFYED